MARLRNYRSALQDCAVAVGSLIAEAGRPTTTKTRVIASHQQIVRVDEEETGPLSAGERAARGGGDRQRSLDAVNALVVSDYAKGFLTPTLLQAVIAAAR